MKVLNASSRSKHNEGCLIKITVYSMKITSSSRKGKLQNLFEGLEEVDRTRDHGKDD
jgi:hypothetical protein